MAQGHAAGTAKVRVLGYVGGPFPLEIPLAFGLSPRLLTADPQPSSQTPIEDWLDDKEDPEIKSVFARAMLGELDVDALVITRRHDHLYYFIKEMLRLGDAPESLPPFHAVDLMQMQDGVADTYNVFNLRSLVDFLSRATGETLDSGQLRKAIAAMNHRREVLSKLEGLRRAGALSGAAAFAKLAEGLASDDPVRHTAELEAYCSAPVKAARPGPKVLLVSSHALGDGKLHEAVEAGGVTVVAEEDGSGRHNSLGLIPDDGEPLAAIAKFYAESVPSVVAHPRAARDAYIRRRVAQGGIDGVVFAVNPRDALFGWDYPRLKATLEAQGIPTVRILEDMSKPAGLDAARSAVAGLVAEKLLVAS